MEPPLARIDRRNSPFSHPFILRSCDFSRVPTGSGADYTPGLPVVSLPRLYHPTVVRGVWGRLGVVYDRVYTPPPKYCRRAPPLDFLAKILFAGKSAVQVAARYIKNSRKFPAAGPPFLRNFGRAADPQIDSTGFLSGPTSPDKTLPADRSIYGQGRRREGRTRRGERRTRGWGVQYGLSRGPHPRGRAGALILLPRLP